jgi:phasin
MLVREIADALKSRHCWPLLAIEPANGAAGRDVWRLTALRQEHFFMELATSKSRAANPVLTPFFDWMLGMSRLDPAAFREFAEKNVTQSKEVYEKLKTSAEDATEMLREACTTTINAGTTLHLKFIEAGRANSNSVLDFAEKLLTVRSPIEFTEVTTAHARKQFELCAEQAREFSATIAIKGSNAGSRLANLATAHGMPSQPSKKPAR